MTDRIDKLGLLLGSMNANINNMGETLHRVERKVDSNTEKIANLDKNVYGQEIETKHLVGLMHMNKKTRWYIIGGGGTGIVSLIMLLPNIIKFILSFFGGN